MLVIAGLITLAGVWMYPKVRWRAKAFGLELTGRIPDIGLADLLVMMLPGSGQTQLFNLTRTRNPYPVIVVPPLSAARQAAAVRDMTPGQANPGASGARERG